MPLFKRVEICCRLGQRQRMVVWVLLCSLCTFLTVSSSQEPCRREDGCLQRSTRSDSSLWRASPRTSSPSLPGRRLLSKQTILVSLLVLDTAICSLPFIPFCGGPNCQSPQWTDCCEELCPHTDFQSTMSRHSKHCKSHNDHCQLNDSSSLSVGQSLYRAAEIMNGTEAVDVCLVISAASSMSNSHRWLQIMVPVLDGHLLTLGIGTGEQKNRYCLVMFGGHGSYVTARFLQVNGQIFFPFQNFAYARRQLKRTGSVADGYEATKFTVLNAPFRESPSVARIIFLVTDKERDVLPSQSNLTREAILHLLYSNNVVMDTIVSIRLEMEGGSNTHDILGLHGYNQASLVLPQGGFEISSNRTILFTQAAGQTINDYVAVSLALGSSSWSLDLLDNEDYNTLLSFANVFTTVHNILPAAPIEVCEKCRCGVGPELACEQPVDQDQCRCLSQRTETECGVIVPTPSVSVSQTYITSFLAPTATPVPIAMEINGNVNSLRGGDTEITFSSNYRQATYQCILMPDNVKTPIINSCTSPYEVSTPTPGRYSFLILGEHGEQRASLLLWFEVHPPSGRLEVSIIQRSISSNGSVLVEFGASRQDVEFQCSTGNVPFFRCTSPHLIPPAQPAVREEFFIVLATDRDGEGAASILMIEDPTSSPPITAAPGPVMVQVWAKVPDANGVIKICFRPSRPDTTCICTVDSLRAIICFNRTTGRGEYSASPDELRPGTHSLVITCMDDDGYSTSETVKFNLSDPPLAPPPTDPLRCNLTLVGPDDRGILLAIHHCNRAVTSECQVSMLPATACESIFTFNTSPLGPGNHIFVLVAEDGFGESVMKVLPFFIETAQRRCCPEISHNSTNVTVERNLLVHLQVEVSAGNCSLNEGFSYEIDWGDTAREKGTKTHLSNLHTSRQYSQSGEYNINAVYCNSPAANEDMCCASIVLPVHLDPPQT